jgi:hypothetical protein
MLIQRELTYEKYAKYKDLELTIIVTVLQYTIKIPYQTSVDYEIIKDEEYDKLSHQECDYIADYLDELITSNFDTENQEINIPPYKGE